MRSKGHLSASTCPLSGVKRTRSLALQMSAVAGAQELSALNPGDLIVAECTDRLTTIDVFPISCVRPVIRWRKIRRPTAC